jgi:hypothetical protein
MSDHVRLRRGSQSAREQLAAFLLSDARAIADCFRTRPQEDSTLVRFDVSVDATGKVSEVRDDPPASGPRPARDCVISLVRAWAFQPPPDEAFRFSFGGGPKGVCWPKEPGR